MENYIGPYWSNGKWQESVEFGDKPSLSGVDAASRLHDSAYAHYTDEAHRVAADEIYSATLKRLREPKSYLADVPLYGNYIKNRLGEIGGDFLNGFRIGGPIGALGSLVYNGVKGISRSNDLIHNGERYRDEVLKYYATDPLLPIGSQKKERKISTVSIPKPIAPLQTNTDEEMFKKTKKIQPQQPALEPVAVGTVTNQVTRQGLYRPLRRKRVKPITAGDLMRYLDYHPDQVARVAAWLEKHPL